MLLGRSYARHALGRIARDSASLRLGWSDFGGIFSHVYICAAACF